ncbi:Ankyrin repeats (3 copies) [Legionella quinlivanii]|uniref:Ankyrin repeats (3 copies) n=1 Tax=Legionella quinlivanii TaxID=45073 RepID=A0A0W0XY84_9GAMM|nr:ankyrin repeat domain-containing protein [Legionella quinlivanii]KTD49735.1 Ankyrin repeats (3 copies) [Legionella quinlivanii]SEG23632.1 Ankyrin repeat [Legionella quinlivanii DSM 21216]STY09900.1 Ribulose-5-phosphate 4-epimerase and related epimerases and aldolases [Legionella quinlivanii]
MFSMFRKAPAAPQAAVTSVNDKNPKGENALHRAARVGNSKLMDELLKDAAFIDAKTELGDTALLIAARGHHYETTKILVNNKASVTIANKRGELPIHFAATAADVDLNVLIWSKETLNALNIQGETPLHYAVAAGSLANVKMLLANSANTNQATIKASSFATKGVHTFPGLSTPVHYALHRDDLGILRELMRYEYNRNLQNERGETAAFLAVSHKEAGSLTDEELSSLLKGLHLEKLTGKKETVLHAAANNTKITASQLSTILSIVNPEAEDKRREINHTLMDAKNHSGKTALIQAVIQKQLDKAELLLSHGANPDIADASGFAAIVYAAQNGDNAMLEKLKAGGADFTGHAGELAIKQALLNNHVPTATLLIKSGAKAQTPVYPSVRIETYSSISSFSSITETQKVNDGKDRMGCIKAGDTALHITARRSSLNETEKAENLALATACLEQNKGLVNVGNAKGKTPPFYALKTLNEDIAPQLFSKGAQFTESTKEPSSNPRDPRYYSLDMATADSLFTRETRALFFKGNYVLTPEQLSIKQKVAEKYHLSGKDVPPPAKGAEFATDEVMIYEGEEASQGPSALRN